MPPLLPGYARASLGALLAGLIEVSCAVDPIMTDQATYRGALDVFLEPADAQGVCAVTLALRNDSGVRQGEARLRLAWFDREGVVLSDQWLRMDPVNVDQVDAKNLVLPVTCERVDRVKVRSAEWALGWDSTTATSVPIDAVDGAERSFRWDVQLKLFVGQAAGG